MTIKALPNTRRVGRPSASSSAYPKRARGGTRNRTSGPSMSSSLRKTSRAGRKRAVTQRGLISHP